MGLKWVKFEKIFIVCTPPHSAGAGGGGGAKEGRLNLEPNFQKEGAWQDLRTSAFREGLLGKRGDFFQGGEGLHLSHTKIRIWNS